MKTLIKKEIRLLLPAWIAAMLLAIVPISLSIWAGWLTEAPAIGVPLGFIVGFLLLGIQSFGQEISSGTFPALLSQPMERRRIWRVKMSVLALAFVSILFVWAVPKEIYFVHTLYTGSFADFPLNLEKHLILFVVTVFTGALWTTLLLRQVVASCWVTLLVPLAIVYSITLASSILNLSDGLTDTVTISVLAVYSISGFFYARHLFLSAQDTQWTGGTFFFWRQKSMEQSSSSLFTPSRNRLGMLLWKEIRLHDANLFIAAILLAIHLVSVGLRSFMTNGNLKAGLEFLWALWLLMPLLIGCSAVAEERRLGVAEAQLCQPVSRFTVLCIKVLAGFILSMILSAALPSLIEWTGNFGITDWPNFWIFVAAPVIFFISFYASTFSRSTIHAIGIAVAVSAAGLLCFCICITVAFHGGLGIERASYYRDYENLCRFYLFRDLCFTVFPIVVGRLMFWNFKWLHSGWRLFYINSATIAAAFVTLIAVTNSIYYRVWELPFPADATTGTARLSLQSPVQISFCDGETLALLPDHRLWQEGAVPELVGNGKDDIIKWNPKSDTQCFIASNWVNVAANTFHIVGIQQNGALWDIPGISEIRHRVPLTRIGSDTNWWKVAADRHGFLLLKRDGTLWHWNNWEPYEIAGSAVKVIDTATPPQQVDAGNSWTNVFSFSGIALAQKDDGTHWEFRYPNAGTKHVSPLVEEQNLDAQWLSYCFWGENTFYGVKSNGQLWRYSQYDTNWLHSLFLNLKDGSVVEAGVPRFIQKIRLGSDSDWKAVTAQIDALILVKNDGTLWKCAKPWQKDFRPVQLGHYSNWVTVGPEMGLALAADGSLWSWDGPSDHIFLGPSRKPVYVGNIFEGSEEVSRSNAGMNSP